MLLLSRWIFEVFFWLCFSKLIWRGLWESSYLRLGTLLTLSTRYTQHHSFDPYDYASVICSKFWDRHTKNTFLSIVIYQQSIIIYQRSLTFYICQFSAKNVLFSFRYGPWTVDHNLPPTNLTFTKIRKLIPDVALSYLG